MTDSDRSEDLAEKRRRNRRERLAGVLRWVEYVREHPPEVWGPQQNRLVNSQLRSARATDRTPEEERRIRAFAAAASDDSGSDGISGSDGSDVDAGDAGGNEPGDDPGDGDDGDSDATDP